MPLMRHKPQALWLYGLRDIKGNLLLLCVAEQYRGAVELCETEGLKKSIRLFISFTPIFSNVFVPSALRLTLFTPIFRNPIMP